LKTSTSREFWRIGGIEDVHLQGVLVFGARAGIALVPDQVVQAGHVHGVIVPVGGATALAHVHARVDQVLGVGLGRLQGLLDAI
jgi:hypothetical protein